MHHKRHPQGGTGMLLANLHFQHAVFSLEIPTTRKIIYPVRTQLILTFFVRFIAFCLANVPSLSTFSSISEGATSLGKPELESHSIFL